MTRQLSSTVSPQPWLWIPNLFSIWVRRPMWRESHRPFLEMADAFDAVIEPGELADEFDHGPTKETRDKVLLVPPVLHLEPNERLERTAARRFLDVPEGMTVVALQLGSGSNFDMRSVRNGVLKALLDRPDTLVLDIRSPIRADFAPDEPVGPRHRIVELFPSFRYSRAFDAAVVAPGYNTFHENILGAVPTLFVPNEADEMDLQLNRARWAELGGFGLLMRRDHDLPHVDSFIERLLDPAERDSMAARCSTIIWTNGADEIARLYRRPRQDCPHRLGHHQRCAAGRGSAEYSASCRPIVSASAISPGNWQSPNGLRPPWLYASSRKIYRRVSPAESEGAPSAIRLANSCVDRKLCLR